MKNNGWYEYLLSKKVSSLNKIELYDLSVNLMNEAMKIHDIDLSNKKASKKQQTYFKDRWNDMRNALGLKPNQMYIKKTTKRDTLETDIELLKSYLYDRTGITEKERLEKKEESFQNSWQTFQNRYVTDNDFTINDYRQFIDILADMHDLMPEFDDSLEILSMFEYYKSNNSNGNAKSFVKLVYDEYKRLSGSSYYKEDIINSALSKMGGS